MPCLDIGSHFHLKKSSCLRFFLSLDAGTFGTMGVGLGFAIAVAQWLSIEGIQHSKVVCVEGDSAFGFSAMEYETACR